MRWTEHQQALLSGMGLRVWQPRPAPTVEPPPRVEPLPRGEPLPKVEPPSAGVVRRPAAVPVPAAVTPPVLRPPEPDPVLLPATAALDWQGLREAVASCQACSLCAGRRQTVFGVGAQQADVMIVGEAPGEQEDLQGEPFVGPAGQLLDNLLRSVGLSRHPVAPQAGAVTSQVFIANTLKCRPPRNRNPDPQEMARCLPYLFRQIELVRPRLLLASGKFAVKALLDSDDAIGRLRGRVHRYRDIPVIVTYHPAYLLRQLPEKAKAWEDLCLAMDTLQRQAPR